VPGELRFITANDGLGSQQRIVQLLIEKVIVSPTDLEVRFRPNGIEVLALELQPEPDREAVEEAVA
jgi:site-specific DNA recombinase